MNVNPNFPVNLPLVSMPSGALFVLNGEPVFIDNSSTYHYAFGKILLELYDKINFNYRRERSMNARLVNENMQLVRSLDHANHELLTLITNNGKLNKIVDNLEHNVTVLLKKLNTEQSRSKRFQRMYEEVREELNRLTRERSDGAQASMDGLESAS